MLCPIKVNSNTIELTLHTTYAVQIYSMLLTHSLPPNVWNHPKKPPDLSVP